MVDTSKEILKIKEEMKMAGMSEEDMELVLNGGFVRGLGLETVDHSTIRVYEKDGRSFFWDYNLNW